MKYKTKKHMSFNNLIKFNEQDLEALTKLECINNKKINKFEKNTFQNTINFMLFPTLITVFFNGFTKNAFLTKGTCQTTEHWFAFKEFLGNLFGQPTNANYMEIIPNIDIPTITSMKLVEPITTVSDLININSFINSASLVMYITLLATYGAGLGIYKHKLNKRAKNLNLALERMEDRTKEDF